MNDAPRPEHSPSPTPREHSIERLLSVLELAEKPSWHLNYEIMLALGMSDAPGRVILREYARAIAGTREWGFANIPADYGPAVRWAVGI